MRLYIVGLIAFATVLMIREPFFFVFAITGFVHASLLRPWPWAIAAIAATSIAIHTTITGFPWPSVELWVLFGTVIVIQTIAIGFGTVLGERMTKLSEERRRALERLESAIEENAGLHRQLVAQAREAGVLDERQRIAREMHDTIAHDLTAIVTQLEAALQSDGGFGRASPPRGAGRRAWRVTDWSRCADRSTRRAPRRSRERPCPMPSSRSPIAGRPSTRSASTSRPPGSRSSSTPRSSRRCFRTAQEALVERREALGRVAGGTDPLVTWATSSRSTSATTATGFEPADARDARRSRLRADRDAAAHRAGRRHAHDRVCARHRDGGVSARVPAIAAPSTVDHGTRPMIRLLIVDDHPVVRDGLRGMLESDPELSVVGEAADGAEALDAGRNSFSPTSS